MSPGEAGSPPGPARGEGEAQGWAWGGAACQGSGSVRSAFGFADIMVHTLPAASWVTASVCPCLWHLGGLSRGDPQKRLGAGRPVPSVIENEGRVCRGVCVWTARRCTGTPVCVCTHRCSAQGALWQAVQAYSRNTLAKWELLHPLFDPYRNACVEIRVCCGCPGLTWHGRPAGVPATGCAS